MKKIFMLALSISVLFIQCKDDEGDGLISDPIEVANQMNANLTILSAGAFTIDPATVGTDNTVIVDTPTGVAPIMAGQTMTNQISFNAPNGNVNAVGMRFGTSGPITFVPVNTNGATNATGTFDFVIDSNICENLSQICHDIKCYEFAQTSAGNITAGSIRNVAMLCGNCDEPSCAGLVDPSDCDTPGGGGTGSFNFGPTGSVSGAVFCSGTTLGGTMSISDNGTQLILVNIGTSGSHNFTSDYYLNGCGSCSSIQITTSSGDTYIANGGSGSWNGNSYSFNASMQDIIGNGAGSVSGSGTCQ
ncbi:MAG: hypothetical protein ACSHW7_09510 [Patiriisocius sp.]|uniref:hypothetical protein n=1 Tax=Patiriisocius sp. TaxID=2822396 RepID=UPI003EF6384D